MCNYGYCEKCAARMTSGARINELERLLSSLDDELTDSFSQFTGTYGDAINRYRRIINSRIKELKGE